MNSSRTRAQALEDRTINFITSVIRLAKLLPNSAENQIIKSQLIKSASSIGANYTEANNAASRTDFRNKILIAKKEAAETRYWLRIIQIENPSLEATEQLKEASELLFILQKIVSTLKNGK